ncbi:OLC1v1007652C2 [Oldenlandia corymbosa var. corymbosa]|uniref:OLC1v1007652C2 n=1 Tax=Oldenlandia corymbosa var. corymbosa TaxID=529605 RepID=A0AAV1DJU6_OLDCO|nr:OLC1v1007652C2 [Oldenlandia corymbosa var. corymbosa]
MPLLKLCRTIEELIEQQIPCSRLIMNALIHVIQDTVNSQNSCFQSEGVDFARKETGKRNRSGEEYDEHDDDEEERSNKISARYSNYEVPTEEYDKILLCLNLKPSPYPVFLSSYCDLEPGRGTNHQIDPNQEPKRGRPRASDAKKKLHFSKNAVDLRSLLTQCAQCVASYDNRRALELLSQIRQHSSPIGDATERLAHYFANSLEARVSGTATAMYAAAGRASAADTLRAYQAYILACPFTRMSHILYGKSILDATKESEKIHIIDFGILYGFNWPCLIKGLSRRPSGSPKLHITGIEFPQSGFRPAERVEETGRRLARYCKIFSVPFEYHAIAKKWETITLQDLQLDKSETTIVMCLHRLKNVPEDDEIAGISPRDKVLHLIREINPEIFIHGILNGTYNAPFFATRCREALHHFSSLFDMFDKNLPRHDQDRLVCEKEVLGRDVMNVIACEGSERVERPNTYKQWGVRNLRVGFRQVPVGENIVKEIRAKVRLNYHKDFEVDKDCNWILQGWKGRILSALSIWKPCESNDE